MIGWLKRILGWDRHWHLVDEPDRLGYYWIECQEPCEWEH